MSAGSGIAGGSTAALANASVNSSGAALNATEVTNGSGNVIVTVSPSTIADGSNATGPTLTSSAAGLVGALQPTGASQSVGASQLGGSNTSLSIAANSSEPTSLQPEGAKAIAGANTTSGGDIASGANSTVATNSTGADVQLGALTRRQFGILAALPAVLAALVFVLAPSEKQEAVKKAPVTWTARFLAVPLLARFAWLSLPWSGYLFGGCMYSAINGLVATMGLTTSCLVPWLEALGVPVPIAGGGGLRASCAGLGSAAGTGLGLAFSTGDSSCASSFLYLNIGLGVVAALLGLAWLKGEGGGVMGLMAAARGG